MRVRPLPALLLLPLLAAAQPAPPRFTLEAEALADRIVAQLDLQPGETFLALAHPGLFDDLGQALRYEVMVAGATDLGVPDVLREPVPEVWDPAVLRTGG